MVYLSKSRYCGLWQCPKIAWLRKNMPEKALFDASVLSRMEAGNEVGDLAMGIFGDYVEVTAYDGEKLDLAKMIAATKAEMEKGTENICEASFSYNGLYCAVDILRKEKDGWSIYEVKSSTKHSDDEKKEKQIYIADISYQKYVLEHCGVNVTGTYLVCLNGDCVFDGTLDLARLFYVTDVSAAVKTEIVNIEANVAEAERILPLCDEPDIDIGEHCSSPYPCAFWSYCSRHLPERSVFDLYRMKFSTKVKYYKKGIITYRDVFENTNEKSKVRARQLEYGISDKGTYVDREKIAEFLKKLSYPLYFLDFETMQPAIPKFVGTHPYTQIPFQYSLHYIENRGGKLMHKEFLAESGPDPRRALAERLCEDIPTGVSVTAYNKLFECGRIKELAEMFPDLAEHLLDIREHIVDLIEPFRDGSYYNREMGGSFSIKSVLPAVFPNDPSLDYHNLEGVHNGGEAMTVFPKLAAMPPAEREKARRDLLKYCELDTYAMVKVWQELVRVTEE